MTQYTDQLRKLLEGLYLRTMDKNLSWSYDEASDSCEASLGDGYVQVAGETDDGGDYSALVKLLNGSKQVMDRIYGGSHGLDEAVPFNTGHKDYWSLLSELKTAAERSALGADRVLDSMLSGLGTKNLQLELDDDVPF